MDDRSGADSDNDDVGVLAETDDPSSHGSGSGALVPRSSRETRNQAEKHRRDKLNNLIHELSTLVPAVAQAPKKPDKTSVLRLSAAFLRSHRLAPAFASKNNVPDHLQTFRMTEQLCESLDGCFMVLSGSGKILEVTNTVERLLGHTRLDLLGTSLYDLACPTDDEIIRSMLLPESQRRRKRGKSESSSSDEGSMDSDDSGSCSGSPKPTASHALVTARETNSGGYLVENKRQIYLQMLHRTTVKSADPNYELVFGYGQLFYRPAVTPNSSNGSSGGTPSIEENYFALFFRLFRDSALTHDSLMEPSRDEYITRHTLDGRIIYCDHRISMVSGYLPEEVEGLSAFKYIYKEELPFIAMALKQMFTRKEEFGSSCYKLRTKNNKCIYLKTFGYLEKDSETETVDSLICMNVLVSKEEGERAIREMRNRFLPLTSPMDLEPRVSSVIIRDVTDDLEEPAPTLKDTTELERILLSDVTDSPDVLPTTPSMPAPNPQFAKAALASKNLPKASVQAALHGITDTPKLAMGSQSHRSGPQSPQTPMAASPGLQQAACNSQERDWGRPSVLCATNSVQPSSPSVPTVSAPSPLAAAHTPTEIGRTSVISGLKRTQDVSAVEEPNKRRRRPWSNESSTTPLTVDIAAPADGATALGFSPGATTSPLLPHNDGYTMGACSPGLGAHALASPNMAHPGHPATSPLSYDYRNGSWSMMPSESVLVDCMFSGSHQHSGTAPCDMIPVNTFSEAISENLPQEASGSYDEGLDHSKSLEQLYRNQLDISNCMDEQSRQVARLDQIVQQIPVDTRQRQIYEERVVKLTLEHTRQERLLQELQRDTHSIQREHPMGV